MTYRLTADAENDLLSIAEFIGRDSPESAPAYIERLLGHCSAVAENPKMYRERSEWGDKVRAAPFGSYLVVYDFDDKEVVILRVLHAKRNIVNILEGGTE